ncbi:cytochrome c biogenesis protein CcdA [Chloroflexota bacterium]
MVDITVGLAFMAGLVSFISPCVLPLVPAYIGYMGGQVTSQVAATGPGGSAVIDQRNRFNTLLHGMFFVLGFTFVFVAFGLLTTAGSLALRGSIVDIQEILTRLGGSIIILFGLHIMGLLPRFINWVLGRTDEMNKGLGYGIALAAQLGIGVILAWALVTVPAMVVGVGAYLVWLVLGGAFIKPGDFWQKNLTRLQMALYMDTRQQFKPRPEKGYAGSAFMGVVFSAGWTPCIGPVYGAVLTMAANGGSLGQAGALLTAYALGLGVPFLLTAFMMDQAQGVLRRLQRNMKTIEMASGILLIIIGVLVLSGQLASLSQLGSSGDFAYNLEHCTTELFAGNIGVGDFSACMAEGPTFTVEGGAEALLPASGAVVIGVVADDAETPMSLLDSVNPLGDGAAIANLPDVGLGEGFLAPAFSTTTATGAPVSLAGDRGDVTIVNFWATWCGPCRVEMPEFQDIYDELADDGLQILAVNRGESAEQIADFQEEFGITFPLLLDEDESITAGDYQVVSMPTTYVLDADGVIVARHLGPATADQIAGYVELARQDDAE